MTAVITLLVVWFVISIPVALFVGAIFTISKRSAEVEPEVNPSVEVKQDSF